MLTHLDDMGLLDKLEEREVEDMGGRSKIEDRGVPSNESYAPDASQSENSFRIVQETINTGVSQ
jgi:hypothetical protein